MGLLAEPGGSAGNRPGLHGPGLRTAATNQPLEIIIVCLCIPQTHTFSYLFNKPQMKCIREIHFGGDKERTRIFNMK